MMTVPVQLKNKSPNVPFEGITLQVSSFTKDDAGNFTPKTDNWPADANGKVSAQFGDNLALEKEVFFAVILKGTSTLMQDSTIGKKLNPSTPIDLEFDYNPVDLLEPAPEVPEPKPLFVYGRLLDKNGKAKLEDIQIIFEATRQGATDSETIAAVQTEANGYFFIDYPEGAFTQASALIGLRIKENPVPIRLETVIVDGEDNKLVFPRHVLLVVEPVDATEPVPGTEGTDGECGCGGLDMHGTKRVLEEYSFYTLVRTTEPEIRGFILEEEDDITLEDVLKHHPIRITEIIDPIVKLPVFSNLSVFPRLTVGTSIAPVMAAPAAAAGGTSDSSDLAAALKNIKINKGVLANFLSRENGITKDNIVSLIDLNEAFRFRRKIAPIQPKPLGRVVLNSDNAVDWDFEPTLYQAISVAHGHLLHFKSEWIADGYSLGDLLYSLPLAPGQKKQIVVFDWERRESASNQQAVDFEESLANSLSRDRDIFEITRGTIQENVSGRSSATTASASAGVGGFLGGVLFGVSGGVGHSGSTASQNSLRQTSASDLQKINDRLVQSANAVRSQRSTVIQTVSQGERFEVSSEVVANYNHCHAVTIQYFEVLRHFKVRQRLADARECLFVPLLMSEFDLNKLLRWKEALQASLIDPKLAKGFEAAERVKNQWTDSNFPSGTFASENILTATGSFQIRFILRRPDDKLVEVDDHSKPIIGPTGIIGYQKKMVEEINEENWQNLIPFLGSTTPKDFYEHYLRDARNKDAVFHNHLGEKIANAFVNSLIFKVADETGNEISSMAFDTTLTSRYRREGLLNITVRFMGPSTFGRDKLFFLKIISGASNILPDFSTITVESGFIRYRGPHYEGFLCNYQNIKDDLSASDGVTLFAGPSADELRNPRKEDLAIVNRLLDHLNDNLEFYHKAIWLRMSPERRFLLLDGIILPPESKGAGRSLASLVENDLIGVVGNSLVFPVAQGLNLDPNFGLSDSLTEFYMVSATDPVSITVPTKGVYAEAMMGKCNSCEQKDESRFWRWEESPIPDTPTTINPINTDTRRADPGNLQAAPMPAPVLNIQNAPAAPDPTGLAGTLALLGKADSFRDITGLTQNQQNALEALKASFDATKSFGQEAGKIEIQRMQEATKLETQKMMDRRLDTALSKIKSSGLPADKQAALMEKAFNAFLGAGPKEEEKQKTDKEKADAAKQKTDVIKNAKDAGVISPKVAENLAASSIQRALFAPSEETAPTTIDAQDLLTSPTLADKDIQFDNGLFKLATNSAGANTGGAGSGSGVGTGAGAGSGSGAPPPPPVVVVTFIIINKIHEPDPVNGVTINITSQAISVANNAGNRVNADLGALADGDYNVEVVPHDIYTTGDFSEIGNPTAVPAPPDRLWLSYTATITKQGNTFTSTDPRVSIQNRNITIRLMPMWMLIGANRSRNGQDPTVIVVHHTDDENQGAYDANFHSRINRSINAWIGNGFAPHYVIDRDGFVVKLCHESRQAFHADPATWDGGSPVNPFSIGIEIVHTNNVRNGSTPTYTEDFTQDQYVSLMNLLQNLVSAFNIPVYGVVGHSDVGTTGGILGRKSSDPGIKFDWTIVEAGNLGLLRDSGAIDFTVVFGGFFAAHPGSSLRAGGAGVTPAIIAELKNDFTRIGYSVTSNNAFDNSLKRAIMVFGEHFLSLDGQDSVSQAMAEVIKKVVAYLATVKP